MRKVMEYIGMVISILSIVATAASIDYSTFNTIFATINWHTWIPSIMVGVIVYVVFLYSGWTARNEVKKSQAKFETKYKELLDYYVEVGRINHAVILGTINNESDTKNMAESLYSYYEASGITIPNWKKYGIDIKVIVELEAIRNEKEKLKIDSVRKKYENKDEKKTS
jgi:hypothetical protein